MSYHQQPTAEESTILDELIEYLSKPMPRRDRVKEFFEWLDTQEKGAPDE